ncbi:TOMM precursor leader peptide-binding protein [Allokutzneria oryzae]|uniref:TOMM leader peptide-binding protein n=1 Tax=Allokutzneria oryzae TaxID=1378989 RepID=A0ABV5ZU30_9PSEU
MESVFHTSPSGVKLRLSGAGAFGSRVLAALGDRTSGDPHLLAGVAQSGHRDVLDAVAREAEAQRLPWIPLVLDGSSLRCGPVAGPGQGPCPDCVERRRRQHSPQAKLSALLPPAEEHAFLPEHIPLAAALLHRAAHTFVHYGQSAAVCEVDLVRGTFEQHRVVAVHACPRCDPPGSAERSWDRLAVALRSAAEVAG